MDYKPQALLHYLSLLSSLYLNHCMFFGAGREEKREIKLIIYDSQLIILR